MCIFTTFINTVLEVLATAIRQENEIRYIQSRKEDCLYLQMTWFDMIIYIDNLKKSKRKTLLELVNKFRKITEYKINTQTSIAFLYANNVGTKIKSTIIFIVDSKEMKCLDINLIKHVQDLYAENCKMLLK